MDLAEKLQSVVIEVDTRITREDRAFCEKNQAAYEEALNNYIEFRFFWETMEETQKELQKDVAARYRHDYLRSKDGPQITLSSITSHINSIHVDYIKAICGYFRSEYKVTIREKEIETALIPEQPEVYGRKDFEKWDEYCRQMEELRITYQDVVDRIMLQLDGRLLTEQAFFELREKCRNAAYINDKPRFERRKSVLRFDSGFCHMRGWPFDGWEIYDGGKDLIRGMAHFETGSFTELPAGVGELISFYEIERSVFEFPDCNKLQQIRLFKNGRADVRFATESDAAQFVSTYLAA